LLAALQDDPSEYVRRSVANHLNDIAKDHPALVAQWLERHLPGASTERRRLLQRASRTLVKRGDPRVLAAWGVGRRLAGTAALSVAPARVREGESVRLTATLASTARTAQQLVVDYAVHHLRGDGAAAVKVWKGWTVSLAPGERRALGKNHSLRRVTTRRLHAGRHAVELRVNGRTVARAAFVLTR
jgi:hypothetical protein